MSTQIVRRIVVALDASPHSHAALEEAAAMAAGLQAELTGIFVIDTELLRLAALPAARETGLTSARQRALTPESMERALKAQSERARVALEAAASRHRLQSSFRLSRGNVVSELLGAAGQADLMAMGFTGQMGIAGKQLGSAARSIRAQTSCSLLLLAPGGQRNGSVVIALSKSGNADLALELAAELAERREADLVVLSCGDSDDHDVLEARIRQQLEGKKLKLIIDDVPLSRFEELPDAIARHHGGLLILGQACSFVAGHDDDLGSIGCPVLLARAAVEERSDTTD